jgi:hypothetical protein
MGIVSSQIENLGIVKFGKANFNHEKLTEKSHIKVHN